MYRAKAIIVVRKNMDRIFMVSSVSNINHSQIEAIVAFNTGEINRRNIRMIQKDPFEVDVHEDFMIDKSLKSNTGKNLFGESIARSSKI